MDIIMQLNSFVKSINSHESITGILRSKLNIVKREGFIPENYYYLTHLINPVQTYWSRKHRDIEKSNEILRKLLLGKKLGRLASFWFRKLPDFITEEGKLDGAFVGIPRVRGSIDFRIGNSIIEFKTKDQPPNSTDEIFNNYPQDIEQLAFYSVLDTMKSEENYLVFMNNVQPYKVKAFKLKINDFGKIKNFLLDRIKLLDEAIEKNNPTNLGQCRYYGRKCQFEEKNLCKCSEMQPLPIEWLKESISLQVDQTFTEKLQSEMDKSDITKELYTIINIIAPRKCLMERKLKIESPYTPDIIKDGYLACMYNLIRKLSMFPSSTQWEQIKNMIKDDRLYIAQRWLNIPSSASKFDKELIPYTVRVNRSNSMGRTKYPTQYSVAELAIECAIYGKVKGLIYTIFPNLNDFIQVYEVIFGDPKGILDIIKQKLDQLDKGMQNGEILLVDACPEWMNDNRECPLTKVCNTENISSCIK